MPAKARTETNATPLLCKPRLITRQQLASMSVYVSVSGATVRTSEEQAPTTFTGRNPYNSAHDLPLLEEVLLVLRIPPQNHRRPTNLQRPLAGLI